MLIFKLEKIKMDQQRKIQSVSKGSDIREDMAMVMTPHANWEEYLMPAPISIAIIGASFLLFN